MLRNGLSFFSEQYFNEVLCLSFYRYTDIAAKIAEETLYGKNAKISSIQRLYARTWLSKSKLFPEIYPWVTDVQLLDISKVFVTQHFGYKFDNISNFYRY